MRSRERWIAGALALLFILTISVPYLYANRAADDAHAFGGFLLNPLDGNSYLAKMHQGFDGAWTFTLPYTAEPGEGAAINLYYLFLGHIARWLGLSLIFTVHLARVLGAGLLCASLYRLFSSAFADSHRRLWAFGLALFGSGLGWLAIAFGAFTSDFWVAEAYPFLAAFANAHFPLGLALQIALLHPFRKGGHLVSAVLAALLSLVYPFGWVITVVALSFFALRHWRKEGWAAQLPHALAVLIGGLPYAAYSLWIVNSHPVLALWNQQNITPAPALLDFLVSFSPALILAVVGAFYALRSKDNNLQLLAIWLVLGAVMVYAPTSLQRRFISGLYVPVAGLAVFAAYQFATRARLILLAMLLLSLPTNLLILLGVFQAAKTQNPELYLQKSELAAFAWLRTHADPGALILASPASGLLLPAYADLRVIYGHPFETAHADLKRAEVEAFFAGESTPQIFDDYQIDYVLLGPREALLGAPSPPAGWRSVFSDGDVSLYAPAQ